MNLVILIIMLILVILIFYIIVVYDMHHNREYNKKKCRDCKYYMSEIEIRTREGASSLCSERYISVMSTDICEKYRK